MSAPLGAKLGLSVAAALATLAALELALRVAGVGEVMTYRPDPRFGYSMAPNQRISTYGPIVAINALGLRGPPVEEQKPAGRARVLVLGDSVAYGGGRVREEELFCRVLESRSRARGRDVEVVNVSAPGWGPLNWLGWLEANGPLDADVVVVALPAIDLARPFSRMEMHGMIETRPPLRLITLGLKARSLLLPRMAVSEETAAANVRALEALRASVAPRGLRLVLLPSNGDRGRADYWKPYEQRFPDALDLRDALRPEHFMDDVHLSAAGHRFVGERLDEALRDTLAALGR